MKCYINRVITNAEVATDIKLLIPDAGVRRRMSRVIKNAVTTAVECMDGVENIDSLDAIVTATGWGCLADSERFLRNIIADKEQLLNPTPFIQSTFNTVGGQIALLRHNHCYNVTYVNRSHSFEDALLDAMMRIADGESKNLLVGAFDEQTPSQHRIMERMGAYHWCRGSFETAAQGCYCAFIMALWIYRYKASANYHCFSNTVNPSGACAVGCVVSVWRDAEPVSVDWCDNCHNISVPVEP